MTTMITKTKVGFIGCGFVGGTWVRYLQEERDYVRGQSLFCYDPGKNLFDDVNQAELVVICVPTPAREDRHCDLSILEEAIQRVDNGKWIVIRSTIPPGTTARLQKKYPDKNFIFIPEFLTEARADEDFRNPDRIVVAPASSNGKAFRVVDTLLQLLPSARALQIPDYPDNAYHRLEVTSTEAEVAKYGGNVMGAWKVAFAESFAVYCQLLEHSLRVNGIGQRVDYDQRVKRIIAADYRIGPSHLQAKHGGYRGFGGYCFIKDTYAHLSAWYELQDFYRQRKAPAKLLLVIASQVALFEAILVANKALLTMQNLSEEEAMGHSEELRRLINARPPKDIADYLTEMEQTD